MSCCVCYAHLSKPRISYRQSEPRTSLDRIPHTCARPHLDPIGCCSPAPAAPNPTPCWEGMQRLCGAGSARLWQLSGRSLAPPAWTPSHRAPAVGLRLLTTAAMTLPRPQGGAEQPLPQQRDCSTWDGGHCRVLCLAQRPCTLLYAARHHRPLWRNGMPSWRMKFELNSNSGMEALRSEALAGSREPTRLPPPAGPAVAHRPSNPQPNCPAGNATQEELMIKDECILVDEADNITGHANKYLSHR